MLFRNKSLSSNVSQLYYNGFIPFCVYTTYCILSSAKYRYKHFILFCTENNNKWPYSLSIFNHFDTLQLEVYMTKQKINQIVGSIGAFIGIIVFIAYIPQIFANLQGNKAQPFQPLSAAVSCLIWVLYGWTKEPKKDWILIIPNSAGVILGGLTFLTSL